MNKLAATAALIIATAAPGWAETVQPIDREAHRTNAVFTTYSYYEAVGDFCGFGFTDSVQSVYGMAHFSVVNREDPARVVETQRQMWRLAGMHIERAGEDCAHLEEVLESNYGGDLYK